MLLFGNFTFQIVLLSASACLANAAANGQYYSPYYAGTGYDNVPSLPPYGTVAYHPVYRYGYAAGYKPDYLTALR